MKKLSFLLIVLGLLTSCDRITGPYTEVTQSIDSTWTPVFTPRTNPVQKILLEDFTGHQCGNCPRAHEQAQQLLLQYPSRLILLSEHVGYFAEVRTTGTKYTYEFRTPEGNAIDSEFGPSAAGLPKGMINRVTYNNSRIHDKSAWGSIIATLINNPAPADLQLQTKLDTTKNELYVAAFIKNINIPSNTNLRLFIFAVEDSIINWQKDYNASPPDIPDYVHRHVLRKSANATGAWGESISFNDQGTFQKQYLIIPEPFWKLKNIYVIAGLYNFDTKEILQVEEVKIL